MSLRYSSNVVWSEVISASCRRRQTLVMTPFSWPICLCETFILLLMLGLVPAMLLLTEHIFTQHPEYNQQEIWSHQNLNKFVNSTG